MSPLLILLLLLLPLLLFVVSSFDAAEEDEEEEEEEEDDDDDDNDGAKGFFAAALARPKHALSFCLELTLTHTFSDAYSAPPADVDDAATASDEADDDFGDRGRGRSNMAACCSSETDAFVIMIFTPGYSSICRSSRRSLERINSSATLTLREQKASQQDLALVMLMSTSTVALVLALANDDCAIFLLRIDTHTPILSRRL